MLKKLKLVGTCLAWEDLNIIGKWSNLEVLKMKPDACRGTEWYQIEATNDHFPALKHLVIRHSLHLQEIPIEFADIYSLQLIELQNCSAKSMASARRVQEDQESLGSKAGNVRSYNDPGLNTSDVMNGVLEFVYHTSNNTVNDRLGPEWISSEIRTSLLHFGIFREDSEIPVKKLMRSWMAEGFLKLENDLEGEAEKCPQELVDRCLVHVCQKSLDRTKVRSCKPFKRVTDDEIDYCLYGLYRALLTPVHRQLRDHDNNDLLKRTHSIFSIGLNDSFLMLKSELIHFKLLKVLDLSHVRIDNFPVQILNLIWLRYLALFIYVNLKIPREICRLWNVQTFIVKGIRLSVITFPEEIWGLMQLRHLKLSRFYLPDCPSGSVDKGRHLDFLNIQTISYLSQRCCTKEVIMGIQNVKELGISGGDEIDSNGPLNNLVHLQQLETLSFIFCFKILSASAKAFPATLKKLKLERTLISWSYLDIIAELPNLEVLKLMAHACLGDEWHPNVQGFTRLKLLLIEDNFLKHRKATDENFLVLERLVLKKCHNLKEIPIEFA
ncbi:hypothetical protein CQW23_06772 [Capsicum baccatum]|uniref:NB-ARC domain-containing protein n=1 Tax=Capsicum baccatum TaxID=33114 RepID=A0A2G2X4C5_CAPBA|nr:hypothetical protein CQW23_06772 [Capsicum baccatum]